MKPAVLRVLILTLGVGLGLLAAELVCKGLDLYASRQYRQVSNAISRPSRIPDVRFELIPGASGLTPGQDKIIRVNAHGFRGPAIQTPKPPNTFRIAVLGDSIAFGRSLDENKVFPYQLPALLQERVKHREFDVINASLSGRDTWEEVALLEQRVLNLQPDLVILQICLNDHIRFPPPDSSVHRGAFGEKPWYAYSSFLHLLDQQFPRFRQWHIATATRMGFDMRTPEEVLKNYALDLHYIHNVAVHWPTWHREFLRARDVCRQHGVRLLLTVFPTSYILNQAEIDTTIPELSQLAQEYNIVLVDLLHPFRAAGRPVLSDYTHPNSLGHRLVAETLADAIARDSLEYSP
jgi:lysophospholipase L1-like esterase